MIKTGAVISRFIGMAVVSVLSVGSIGYGEEPDRKYYENGKLKSERAYNKAGKTDGLVKFYYESGQLEDEIAYKNGKPEGPFKRYFENGKLKSEGVHKNGKIEGLLKTYNENGGKEAELVYENGDLINGTLKKSENEKSKS